MAYPLPKFHFLVKWDPGVRAGFTEVTGLDMQIEAIEWYSGLSNVPPEYMARVAPCGILVIHSRRR